MAINCETWSNRINSGGKYHLGIIQSGVKQTLHSAWALREVRHCTPSASYETWHSSGCGSSTTLGFIRARPAHRNHLAQNQAFDLKEDDYSLYSSKRSEQKLNCKGTVSPPDSANCTHFSFTYRFYAKIKMNLPNIFISTVSFHFPVQ